MTTEAARVHLPHIEAGETFDDPLGDELPHSTGSRQPVGTKTSRHPEAANVSLAEDELTVRGERLRTVDQPHDLEFLQVGDAHDRVPHELVEALPIFREELAVEVRRDAAEPPWCRVALVTAHDEPAGLSAEVDEQGGIAHRRQVEGQAARPRDEIFVRHRDDRHRDPGEPSDLAREHASRVHQDLGLDPAFVGLDADDAAALNVDAGDTRIRVDLGAAAARPLRERESQLTGVDVAVAGKVRGAEHALGRHRGKEPLRFLWRDELERQSKGLRPAGLAAQFLHALLRRRESKRADLVPPRLEPDFVLQPPIELDRLHHHPRQAERTAQLPDEAGGMEGRAARQVGSLAKDDVVPAEPGEPVEDGRAADAAADHHRPC